MQTPATNCTNSSWRKNGNAIDNFRRIKKGNKGETEHELPLRQTLRAKPDQ